jgi:hypothetical protein
MEVVDTGVVVVMVEEDTVEVEDGVAAVEEVVEETGDAEDGEGGVVDGEAGPEITTGILMTVLTITQILFIIQWLIL